MGRLCNRVFAVKSNFILFYNHGTCGTFISNILNYYQNIKSSSINFDLTSKGEAYKWKYDSSCSFHMEKRNEELKNIKIKNADKHMLLIEFHEGDVNFITRMYWMKLYKKTLTRERYEYCRSLIHNGSAWAEYEHWQDDPEACLHLFEMHRASYMQWIDDVDRSLMDLILPFDDIFNSPELNQKLAGWCDSLSDRFIDEYIDRYRTVNKKLVNNFKL